MVRPAKTYDFGKCVAVSQWSLLVSFFLLFAAHFFVFMCFIAIFESEIRSNDNSYNSVFALRLVFE